MKVVWISDPHFNFINMDDYIRTYIKDFNSLGDVTLYTGDITTGKRFHSTIRMIGDGLKSAFFVTGNHDFYHSSWFNIDKFARDKELKAILLDENSPVKLTDNTVLVGVGGWTDGFSGDFFNSNVYISDYTHIKELSYYCQKSMENLKLIQQRANIDKIKLENQLNQAIKLNPTKIIVASHVPIFIETNLAPDKTPSDNNWLPHMSWASARNMIVTFALNNPNIEFLCLAGHTHTEAHKKIEKNLIAKVAGAKYYYPCVQEVIEIE